MNGRRRSNSGFLKKFMDRSVIFDFLVLFVLALDAYLLQKTTGTYSESSITTIPPPTIEILAAQATAVLIIMKILNVIVDSGK